MLDHRAAQCFACISYNLLAWLQNLVHFHNVISEWTYVFFKNWNDKTLFRLTNNACLQLASAKLIAAH
jgi:hypothetical protein